MNVKRLAIEGALVVQPEVFQDDRGYFKEIFASDRYREAGIPDLFVQDNVSVSRAGVLRGLHGDARMAKLVQVLAGRAFDVIADLRPSSPTYKRWHGVYLSGADHTQIYIPAGCFHGFLALADDTVLLYKQSALYSPAHEIGLAWDDPDLAINWPLEGARPKLSPKDAENPTVCELEYL